MSSPLVLSEADAALFVAALAPNVSLMFKKMAASQSESAELALTVHMVADPEQNSGYRFEISFEGGGISQRLIYDDKNWAKPRP